MEIGGASGVLKSVEVEVIERDAKAGLWCCVEEGNCAVEEVMLALFYDSSALSSSSWLLFSFLPSRNSSLLPSALSRLKFGGVILTRMLSKH